MTMWDYGLARLSDLTEQLRSSDTINRHEWVAEIITILSDLAASLRDGESRSKLELIFRIRTRAATGVYVTHYAGRAAFSRDRGRQIPAGTANWAGRSELWCR
jgi:hypothetical protein